MEVLTGQLQLPGCGSTLQLAKATTGKNNNNNNRRMCSPEIEHTPIENTGHNTDQHTASARTAHHASQHRDRYPNGAESADSTDSTDSTESVGADIPPSPNHPPTSTTDRPPPTAHRPRDRPRVVFLHRPDRAGDLLMPVWTHVNVNVNINININNINITNK